MTTLAKDNPQVLVTGDMNAVGIIADDIVFEGAMVGDNAAGYGRPLVAGDRFLGHSILQVDNTGGLAGDKNIRLRTGIYRLCCDFAVAITNVGALVYASDDATLTLTATANSYVGRVSRYVSATKAEVEFEALRPPATV